MTLTATDKPHAAPRRDDALAWMLRAMFFLAGPVAALAPKGMVVLLVAGAVPVAGLWLWRERVWRQRRHAAVILWGAFVLYAAVTVLWSPVPGRALWTVAEFVYVFLPAFLVMSLVSELPEHARGEFEAVFLAGFVLGLVVLVLEVAVGHPAYHLATGQTFDAAVGDPVVNRPLVVFALLVWPAAAIAFRRGWRILAAGLLAVMFFLTLLLTSQSALLGMAAGLLVLPMTLKGSRAARGVVMAGVVAGFVGAIPLATAMDDIGLTTVPWLSASARHRVEIWRFTAERVGEAPVLGQGLDASRAMENHGSVSIFSPVGRPIIPLHPHNLFLQVWLELGAIGAVLVAAVGLAGINAARRLDPLSQRFAVPLAAAALAMLSTAYGAWQAWWLSSILFAVLFIRLGARCRPEQDDPLEPI